ncbi:MAG TPA: cisplatin damage response ATP-dependent DNA ligase, partial [Rhizomicrobium sp.]|nr:cisplatin damage response ATP-dependent DNA ligase [Rhizomicrobium sp.]
MRAFSRLLDRLAFTPARNAKLTLLRDYLRQSPDPERGWALAALTGALGFDVAKPTAIRKAIESRMDAQLFALSYDYVGDLAETVALVWPKKTGTNPEAERAEPQLSEVVDTLQSALRHDVQRLLEAWLDALDADGRWALLKLLTGGLRVGVSARLAKQALATLGNVDVAEIEEIWHGQHPPYEDLFAWLEGRSGKPTRAAPGRFRPVMLAQALDETADLAKYSARDFAAEWKWDGIRVQAVSEAGVKRLFSRTGDEIGHSFPDVVAALRFEGIIDGELLVVRDSAIAPFSDLQQRLKRKMPDANAIAKFPAGIRAYDLLLAGESDLRSLPFRERRARLESLVAHAKVPGLDLSPLIPFDDWLALAALRASPPAG